MLTCTTVVLLALFASTQGRAVNISNTWVLPEEGFPVFYRYFRDRISWYEADAVCQFHHANLVTVDTTAQYDAVRAYLKELDISSAVWVGLIRSNPDGDFTWTDYRGLSGDGYWSSAPDARAAPLCAAADPAADYRWEARACGGPTVASFICELPVPQWALGNEGCMVRELPALTILYLPESAAVQLTADCGLAGVKRVQCTGNMKRESLLKDLSCVDENEFTTASAFSTGSWTTITDTTFNITDQDSLTETTAEEDITTEREIDVTKSKTVEVTPLPYVPKVKQQTKANKLSNLYSQKNVNIDILHTNNQQSNDIPKLASNDNYLSVEQSEKLEDEKHMHHKMLHDELARHGNFETIFTQPTDHFVPPLVMAKAKISDDMTVLSLAEKHAQQLAEQHFAKTNIIGGYSSHVLGEENSNTPKITTEGPNKVEIIDRPLVMPISHNIKVKEVINKDKSKNSLPKKYKEKYDDPKNKHFKIDNKLFKFEKTLDAVTPNSKATEVTTDQILNIHKNTLEDNLSIELQVILKEPTTVTSQTDEYRSEQKVGFTSTEKITTMSSSQTDTNVDQSRTITPRIFIYHNLTDTSRLNETQFTHVENVEKTSTPIAITPQTESVTMNHEVIKITLLNDNVHTRPTETVFEITTRVPEFKETVSVNEHEIVTTVSTTKKDILADTKEVFTSTSNPTTVALDDNVTTIHTKENTQSEMKTSIMLTKAEHSMSSTTIPQENQTKEIEYSTEPSITTVNIQHSSEKEKMYMTNTTDVPEDLDNDSAEDPEEIDDSDSPLLSAANQPARRPNRSRRPQTPSRISKKFNPFRILG